MTFWMTNPCLFICFSKRWLEEIGLSCDVWVSLPDELILSDALQWPPTSNDVSVQLLSSDVPRK